MSLLQKASIVTTPTAYGVGVLNSIKPAQSFSEELVTNGNFNTDSDWTKETGWTISGGTASRTNTGTYTALQQNILTIGKKYEVTIQIKSVTSGSLFGIRLGTNYILQGVLSSTGVYTGTGIASNATLSIMADPTFAGSIDNVSVKEVTDADFDFTRTSSATRVNPDYLLETVSINSANLVQNGDFSELGSELITNGDFATDSSWSKGTGVTISGGSANFNGAINTDIRQDIGLITGKTYKIVFTVSNYVSGDIDYNVGGNTRKGAIAANGTYTDYVVSNSGALLYFQSDQSLGFVGSIDNVSVKQVDPNDNWDLDTGWSFGTNKAIKSTTATSSSFCSQDLPLVNNSLYKIQFDLNITSATTTSIGISNSGAFGQLSSSERFYTTSGTKTITALFDNSKPTQIKFVGGDNTSFELENVSIIEIQQNGVPRLDYTNGTASILLEPQSTNLETKSNGFSTWTVNSNITRTADYIVSPDGTSNGTRLLFTGNGFTANTAQATSVQNTISCYAKRNDSGTQNVGFFKTGSGVVDSAWALTSEWKKFSFTYTAPSGFGFVGIAGDSGADVSVYGFQIEVQSYATSYIPTDGSTVTRAAETLNNAGNSDLINSTEGVLYLEVAALALTNTLEMLSLNDGTFNNVVLFRYYDVADNNIQAQIKVAGSVVASFLVELADAKSFNKIAVKYKANDFSLWVNGTEVGTDTSGNTFSANTLDRLSFDRGDGGNDFYGKCKTVAVFKEALSDTELACLTSTNNREIFLNYYYRMQYVGANTEALSCAEQTFNI